MPNDEYISPYQEERELIDIFGDGLLKAIWNADKGFDLGLSVKRYEIESRVGKIASGEDKLLKSYKDLAKETLERGNKERLEYQRKLKEQRLIKVEDTLLKSLWDASPKGSPVRSLNTFEFVLLLKDFDPMVLALTSPVRIEPKPEGDYLLLQFEQVYIRYINRSERDLRAKDKINWRVPKGWFPADETETQRQERIKAKIKRTVKEPDPEDFSKDLNPDLSKFAVPKVEYIPDEGWEPNKFRMNLLDEQSSWLSRNGSKEEEEKFRKHQNRSDQIIESNSIDPPPWFYIVQYVDEINSISLEKGLPITTHSKAIREYRTTKHEEHETFKGWEEVYKTTEDGVRQKWRDEFKIASQFIYIAPDTQVIEG